MYVFIGDPRDIKTGTNNPQTIELVSRDSQRRYTFVLNGDPVEVDKQDEGLVANNSHFKSVRKATKKTAKKKTAKKKG